MSADTVVPSGENPQAWNRYSYTFNNPLGLIDPDGHDPHWCNGDTSCITNYSSSMGNAGSQKSEEKWTTVAYTASPEYSNFNEGVHGGCTICHAAKDTPYTALTNDELAASINQMHQAAFEGGVAMAIGAVGGVSLAYASEVLIGGACADGDCGNEAQTILNGVTKAEARTVLRRGMDQLTTEQTASALKALGKGRVDSMTIQVASNGNAQLIAERAGNNGFQRLTYLVDPSGKTISILQQAYNSSGELAHEHEWISNIITK